VHGQRDPRRGGVHGLRFARARLRLCEGVMKSRHQPRTGLDLEHVALDAPRGWICPPIRKTVPIMYIWSGVRSISFGGPVR